MGIPGQKATLNIIVVIITMFSVHDDVFQVIIINHHPPGTSDYLIHASRWYESLAVNFSHVIVLQVAGHTHTDEFRLVREYNCDTVCQNQS